MAGVRGQGPFKKKPKGKVPSIPDHHADGRWEQVRNGDWYAFYSNIGPSQSDYHFEHPDDPNWWADTVFAHPEDDFGRHVWACRHGYYDVGPSDTDSSNCPDGGSCGAHPQIVHVTDEEVEEAGQKLAALLASMESK